MKHLEHKIEKNQKHEKIQEPKLKEREKYILEPSASLRSSLSRRSSCFRSLAFQEKHRNQQWSNYTLFVFSKPNRIHFDLNVCIL